MADQSTHHTQTTTSSHLPAVTLALVIALWYAWGLGLVLMGVL
jgi:hypothetical protein